MESPDISRLTYVKVLLRWSTQRGLSVIPKSNSQHRLQQNLDVTSFDLKDDEISAISDLDKNLKFNVPTNVHDPAFTCFF
jgi:D-xylose reductase